MEFHSMNRKELQLLCKRHNIPANLKNSEMANRLTSLLNKGEEDKVLGENGCEIESGVENKRVKKVRFSSETETFEFQKSEVKYVTRSRGRRLVQKAPAAAKKGGKTDIKNNEASVNILPSQVENKDRVMTRNSSRGKEVVGEGKRSNEDVEKGLKRKGRERKLRKGKGETRANVAVGGERDTEFTKVGEEKVLRRSKRNVTEVADHKQKSSGTVAAESSLKSVNSTATEAVERKEKSPVLLSLRRSRKNVCRNNEPSVTFDHLVAEVSNERKRKRQRTDLVKEKETVLVDSISIELPLAPLSHDKSIERAIPESVVGKFAHNAESASKKQNVEIEDTLCKNMTSAAGSSLNSVNSAATEAVEETENSPVVLSLRRSRRNASANNEPLVTSDHIVAEVSHEKKRQRQRQRQRRDLVEEQETVLVDSISIELPLAPLASNVNSSERANPESVVRKFAQNAERASKKQTVEIEDSLFKDLTSEGLPEAGSSLNSVNTAATEAVEETEKSPVVLSLRRSRRNASVNNEPLVTLDHLAAEVSHEKKRERQRRDLVKEQETVLVDSISIELPLAPLASNVNSSERAVSESVVGKFAQNAEWASKKPTVEIEDSLCKDLTSEGLPEAGSSLNSVNTAVTEAVEETEKSPVVLSLRRSRRNTSVNNEPLVTLDHLVAEVSHEKKRERRRRDLVKEQETVPVDGISIELPLASLASNVNSSERAVPESVVEKFAQNADRESKKKTVEIEDSLCKDLASEELSEAGSSLNSVNAAATEAVEETEKSPVVLSLRRSRRNASGNNEPLVALDHSVAEVSHERKRKYQRRDLVKERETVMVDSISIELPLAPLSGNVNSIERAVPESVVGKFAQKDESTSKKQTVKIEDSLCTKDLASEELPEAVISLNSVKGAAAEAVEGKEKSPVVSSLRRSRRNVSSNNDHLVAEVSRERKSKRRNLVKEQETVLVDSINIELPLAPLSRNVNSSERAVPESVVGEFSQKAERASKKQTVKIEDSLCKDLTSEEFSDVDIQPSLAEVTEGAIVRISEKKGFFTDNLMKLKRRPGRKSGKKSPPKSQDSSKDVNMKITASESTELDTIQPGVGASTCQNSEIDQLGNTDSGGIQVWIDHSIGMETMSRPASLDQLVEDERISSVNSFESGSSDVLEGDENASLNGLCEGERSASSMKDKTSEVNPANFKDAVPNYNGDCNSTFNSGRELDCQDLSQIMQTKTNNVKIDDVSVRRNIDQEVQKCNKSVKSLKENYDTPVRMPRDGNENGGENTGVPKTDDNVTESSYSQNKRGTLISSSGAIEVVLELNSTPDDPERSIDVMDDKPLEPMKQSPVIQWMDAGLNDATKAKRYFEDLKISADLPKLDNKEEIVDKYLEPNPFHSSECKLNVLEDVDADVVKGFNGDVDSKRSNLAMEVFSADNINESNESYENQPEKYGDAESGIQEAEKVDNNFGELASSEVLTTEVSTVTMNVDIALEQKGQSAILDICGSEADCLPEEDIAHGQLDFKNCNELDQSVEHRHIDKPCQSENLVSECGTSDRCKRSTRKMMKIDVLNNSDFSKGNTADLEVKKEVSAGLVELCGGEKCSPEENFKYDENPAKSEDVEVTTKCGCSICPDVSMEHNYDESSAAVNSGLEHRGESPCVQGKGDEAGSVAKVNRKYDEGELKWDEQHCFSNKRRSSSVPGTSIRSARRILPVEIGDEDSLGLQKNYASPMINYEVQSNKEGKFSFTHPCTRGQRTSAEGDSYKENLTTFDHAMTAMRTEDPSSTRNLGVASRQREHSPAVDRNVYGSSSVAEVDRDYGEGKLKCEDLFENIEDRPFDDKYHISRSILKDGGDSAECQKSLTKTFKDENIGITEFHEKRKCDSVIDDNSEEVFIYSESPIEAILPASGDFSHIPLSDNSEHTAFPNSDMPLDQREQTLDSQINDCCANNVPDCPESCAQLGLSCDESAESVDARGMEEHHHLPYKCLLSKASYPPTRASRMLQGEIVGGSEDTVKCVEHYRVAPEEDGTAGPNESLVIGRHTSTDNYEGDNSENSVNAEEIIRTAKFAHIPMVDKDEDNISSRNLEMKLKKNEQSLAKQQNGCETNSVDENNTNHVHDLDPNESAKLVEGSSSQEHCNSPNKCQMLSLLNPSRRILEHNSIDAGKDFNKSGEFLGTSVGDTGAEGIPSPLSDNDAAQEHVSNAGDEIFAQNGTKEGGYGISEKISDFASSEHLSEANLNVNDFQEEFSSKGQEEDGGEEHRENLTPVFSQVQFASTEIHEDKILNIVDDVSSNLSYKNHEILKECDVADTINEYIESESIMNSSPRIEDNNDSLKVGVFPEVPEPEDKVSEETNDTITSTKSEVSLERDQENSAEETALRSGKISDSKPTTNQRKNSDIAADKTTVQLSSEMKEKDMRVILIHGTPRKLQTTADMKENLPCSKIEKVGSLTTVKPAAAATKRAALKGVFTKKM